MKTMVISGLPNDEELRRMLISFGVREGDRVNLIAETKSGIVISAGLTKLALCGDFGGFILSEAEHE